MRLDFHGSPRYHGGTGRRLRQAKPKDQWGSWLLFPTVPDRAAIMAKEVQVTADQAMKAMEIWAVADGAAETRDGAQ